MPQQVAAGALGAGSLPGAFAEWGCLWGQASAARAWLIGRVLSAFPIEQYFIFQGQVTSRLSWHSLPSLLEPILNYNVFNFASPDRDGCQKPLVSLLKDTRIPTHPTGLCLHHGDGFAWVFGGQWTGGHSFTCHRKSALWYPSGRSSLAPDS